MRKHTLWQIACGLQARRPQRFEPTDAADTALGNAVARFRRLRPFAFTSREQCLFHALALTRFLHAHDLPATWIIGVRLHPWGAHSWVQHESRILDATPESVRGFQPIVAV